jgi:NTP pyrophosphatase (non-canonical NTP hydrolase)
MNEVVTTLRNFRVDRPEMDQNNDLRRIIELAEAETNEIYHALDNGHTEDEVASEIADAIVFLLNALMEMGRDPKEEIMTKIAYNHIQHPAYLYDGSIPYSEARVLGKQWASDRNMRGTIYQTNAKE